MATTAADRVFVDTNIHVYSAVPAAPLCSAAAQALASLRAAGADLWISRQVIREYMAAVTRPQTFSRPFPAATVASDVVGLQSAFHVAEDGPGVTSQLLRLLAAVPIGGKQVHDANIVATMLENNVSKLLTHNTADFARFSSFITVLPLVPSGPAHQNLAFASTLSKYSGSNAQASRLFLSPRLFDFS